MPRLRSKKENFVRIKIFVILFLIAILTTSLVYFLLLSPFFKIITLDVKLNGVACLTEQAVRILPIKDQNIFLLDQGKIERIITGKYNCVKSLNLMRNLPNKVIFEIFGREAKAAVYKLSITTGFDLQTATNSATVSATEASSSSQINATKFLVDEEGAIFSKDSIDNNLPRIYLYGDSQRLKQAVKIIENLKKLGMVVTETKIYSKDEFLTITTPKILFSLLQDIDKQLAALQLIISKAKIENENLEFIDLRFDKPIIRYGQR